MRVISCWNNLPRSNLSTVKKMHLPKHLANLFDRRDLQLNPFNWGFSAFSPQFAKSARSRPELGLDGSEEIGVASPFFWDYGSTTRSLISYLIVFCGGSGSTRRNDFGLLRYIGWRFAGERLETGTGEQRSSFWHRQVPS